MALLPCRFFFFNTPGSVSLPPFKTDTDVVLSTGLQHKHREGRSCCIPASLEHKSRVLRRNLLVKCKKKGSITTKRLQFRFQFFGDNINLCYYQVEMLMQVAVMCGYILTGTIGPVKNTFFQNIFQNLCYILEPFG